VESAPSAAARATLEVSGRALLARPFQVVTQLTGVRVNLPDRRPIAGRHPRQERIGVINGLGAKGALFAPLLARQWVNHLTEGVGFDAEIALGRF
jgi:glycine/D-amino acid oxidase-like deaminating enzyme